MDDTKERLHILEPNPIAKEDIYTRLFMGQYGRTGDLICICTPDREANIITDKFAGVPFKAEPGNVIAGSNTNLHEGVLVHSNIRHLKSMVVSNVRSFPAEPNISPKLKTQHERLFLGKPPLPLFGSLPANADRHRPDFTSQFTFKW